VLLPKKNPKYTVSSSNDKTLKVWDTKSVKLLYSFDHDNEVTFCAISHNSKMAASITQNFLKVWNLEKGKPMYTLSNHSAYIGYCAFSPNDTTVLSCAYQDATLWNLNNGKEFKKLPEVQMNPVSCCDYFNNGKEIVTCAPNQMMMFQSIEDNTIRFFDVNSGKESNRITWQDYSLEKFSISTDYKNIAVADRTSRLKIIDIESKQTTKTLIDKNNDLIIHTCWSKQGTQILTLSWGKNLKIWDIKSGNVLGVINDVDCFALGEKFIVTFSGRQPILYSFVDEN